MDNSNTHDSNITNNILAMIAAATIGGSPVAHAQTAQSVQSASGILDNASVSVSALGGSARTGIVAVDARFPLTSDIHVGAALAGGSRNSDLFKGASFGVGSLIGTGGSLDATATYSQNGVAKNTLGSLSYTQQVSKQVWLKVMAGYGWTHYTDGAYPKGGAVGGIGAFYHIRPELTLSALATKKEGQKPSLGIGFSYTLGNQSNSWSPSSSLLNFVAGADSSDKRNYPTPVVINNNTNTNNNPTPSTTPEPTNTQAPPPPAPAPVPPNNNNNNTPPDNTNNNNTNNNTPPDNTNNNNNNTNTNNNTPPDNTNNNNTPPDDTNNNNTPPDNTNNNQTCPPGFVQLDDKSCG